jgi:superfamily I DNA/RNA helicase
MTLHMAKGLEFPVVFITGCEDGLVPCTIMRDGVDIEEERRLFYVGMTRAKDGLYLIHARNRFLYGRRLALSPSPFIGEIPKEFISRISVQDRVKKQKDPDRQLGLF